jgi:hypothetical protein
VAALDAGLLTEGRVRLIGALQDVDPDAIRGISVFKSVGVAIQDWVTARQIVAGIESRSVRVPEFQV